MELELDPAIAGSLMEAAHRQRRSMRRGDVVETVMQCSGDDEVSGASRRWLRALSDRSRVCRWGLQLTVNLEPPAPTSLYSAVRRGPTNHVGLGAPDQDA